MHSPYNGLTGLVRLFNRVNLREVLKMVNFEAKREQFKTLYFLFLLLCKTSTMTDLNSDMFEF